MSKFLVTDPAYIITSDDWDDFMKATDHGEKLENPYSINGIGKITKLGSTDGGSTKVGVSEVKTYSGSVAILEVSNMYKKPRKGFGALTSDKNEANQWYEEVVRDQNA